MDELIFEQLVNGWELAVECINFLIALRQNQMIFTPKSDTTVFAAVLDDDWIVF